MSDVQKFPSIPEPARDIESMFMSVLALKEGYELLSGQRGDMTAQITYQFGSQTGTIGGGGGGSDYQLLSEKGLANGYPSLGADGKVPQAQLPAFVNSGVFTPEQFGAVGDGATDDLAAFNALFAAVKQAGGGKIVAVGNYFVSAQINVTGVNNWELDGQSRGRFTGPGRSNPTTGKFSDGHVFWLYQCSHVHIHDLRAAMPRSLYRGTGMCFRIVDSQHVKFTHVHTDGGTCGIWFYTCQFCFVENCVVDTPKADGIHFGQGSSYCKAIGNTVLNPGDDGFSTTYYTGFPRPKFITFDNNTVVGGVWGSGIAVWSGDNCVVSNNTLVDIAGPGIQLTIHQDGALPTNCVVTGNRVQNCGLVRKQPESYWFGTDPAKDPDVTANIASKSALFLHAQKTVVSGNSFSHNTPTSAADSEFKRYGVYVYETSLCAIIGNQFSNINGEGVLFEQNTIGYNVVQGNTFDQVYGIPIHIPYATQFPNRIVGNSFGFCATRSYTAANCVRIANQSGNTAVVGNAAPMHGSTWLSVANSPQLVIRGNAYAGQPAEGEAVLPAHATFDTITLRPGGDPQNGARGTPGKLFAGPSGRFRVYEDSGQAKYVLSEYR